MTTPSSQSTDQRAASSSIRGTLQPHSQTRADAAIRPDALPPLTRDTSFWSMATTQFLGAFNDNVFKQLILLLATPVAVQAAAEEKGEDLQWAAMFVFAGAFLLFSGFAGFLSDRFSKRPLIILAKVAEIAIMLLGLVGFMFYDDIGFGGMLVVLFLMGMQSAFFGPAKYGILPEMVRGRDLPRANGIFLMFTFLAIIFGVALAGALLNWFGHQRVWLASLACVAIAVVGTATSLFVRPLPAAQPDLKYDWSCWGVSTEILGLLKQDRELMRAVFVVSIFWMIGGIVQPALNALGKTQLGLDELRVSVLSAAVGIGIATGCILGGYLSRNRINPQVVAVGAIGLMVTMIAMSLPGGPKGHLLGYWGSIPVLILMGVFTGMFIVPIQVLLQSRPPRGDKGRMIATMNQCTWLGIILSAVLYKGCIEVLDAAGGQRNLIFAVSAAIMLPVVLLYRPPDERLADT